MANRGKKDTYQVQIEINSEEEWNDLCSKVVKYFHSLNLSISKMLIIQQEV